MDSLHALKKIRKKFSESTCPVEIPLLRGNRSFSAELVDGGIEVSNLGSQPFLPWEVFQEALCVLIRSGGRAKRGDAMNHRLGDPQLSLDSIEGHIAHIAYGKKPGDSVFRRITPIVCVLVWSGVCEAAPGEVVLLEK